MFCFKIYVNGKMIINLKCVSLWSYLLFVNVGRGWYDCDFLVFSEFWVDGVEWGDVSCVVVILRL